MLININDKLGPLVRLIPSLHFPLSLEPCWPILTQSQKGHIVNELGIKDTMPPENELPPLEPESRS